MTVFHRILMPRPVVLVTTIDRDGRPNIMSAAWITPVSSAPPLIAISIAPNRYSHSLIKENGEFVANIPSRVLVKEVEYCGHVSGKSLDKFKAAKLTAEPAKRVKAPIIKECIGHLECRMVNSVAAGDHTVFIGEVLAAYADESLFSERSWNLEKAKVLQHLTSNFYSTPGKSFQA
jgi:flavin reductase (DIM6/NTAB) family NADH-FMN oxidoreductase RutF